MMNTVLRSIALELSEREVRYISHALSELMAALQNEIEKDPEGDNDITPMYAEDILHLRDVYNHIKGEAVPVFGEQVLSVSYETL